MFCGARLGRLGLSTAAAIAALAGILSIGLASASADPDAPGVRHRLVQGGAPQSRTAVPLDPSAARYSSTYLAAASQRVVTSPLVGRAGITMVSQIAGGRGLNVAVKGEVPDRRTRAEIARVAGLGIQAVTYSPRTSLTDLPLEYR